MIVSDGKNQFPDNRFEYWEWSAPILQTPEEVMQKVYELRIENRIVRDIVAIGMGYNWNEYGIDEAVYHALERMDPERRAKVPDLDAFLPEGLKLPCLAEIDEPLQIIFEDGDVLGLCFSEGSCVRLELNTLPLGISPGTNRNNFHADRLFREMIGKSIISVDVVSSTAMPDFTGSFGQSLEHQPWYVVRLDLLFKDLSSYEPPKRLSFAPFLDYGWVEIADYSNKTVGIPTEEVPAIVEGFIQF